MCYDLLKSWLHCFCLKCQKFQHPRLIHPPNILTSLAFGNLSLLLVQFNMWSWMSYVWITKWTFITVPSTNRRFSVVKIRKRWQISECPIFTNIKKPSSRQNQTAPMNISKWYLSFNIFISPQLISFRLSRRNYSLARSPREKHIEFWWLKQFQVRRIVWM